jgi:two-component system, OmpR family, sensor kinase
LRLSGRQAVLEISDTGPGIPPEDRARVFDRFYRREAAHVPGSGLGLAIVKNIADRHHASVLLDNRFPGPGLRVTVCFPLA